MFPRQMKALANLMSLKWRSVKGTSTVIGRYKQKKQKPQNPMTVCVCARARAGVGGGWGEEGEGGGRGERRLSVVINHECWNLFFNLLHPPKH